ncbi:MAG: aminomethyl-transferring glycine dehydrogenase subunit GcvPA, partial [Francisellaceae bacterium]|jgi:glycine dehydrogenase subunit 1|nr:aminomethyl-transferring glycine dehydrogenase subunit GcvPA [Francisellaceae bacterium]MBT6206548.1 aminomethyl-transferring glycine dehydrogenase subunit GcvPA [Francisellaceae bacterium]MBT6539913.1 aminomethyl-transferring glycine dehydrogenase subunit GcvPA [Francisellaceae bacterium]
MTYAPHTEEDIAVMLSYIGCENVEELFDEVPPSIRIDSLPEIAPAMSELELTRKFKTALKQDRITSNFIGAGSYEHYSPPTVWDLTFRGEFLTAYTPYQAEASQGTLQLIYEYQSMMAKIMNLDVSNASLYDGASALAEAVLMAVRAKGKKAKRRILLPKTTNPLYRDVVKTIITQQGIDVVELEYDGKTGVTTFTDNIDNDFDALVISQPNFFGVLEDVDSMTNYAHEHNMLVVAVVNPVSCFIVNPPGTWGDKGADIACGEGQSLGIPLSSGGPYYGFLVSTHELVRHMPGRIVGKTVDTNKQTCYTLTLQAREQHIRRSKATSNICTNQGLMVTASTIYMSLLGSQGLSKVALASNQNSHKLKKMLEAEGVEILFDSPFYCEFVIDAKNNLSQLQELASANKITLGYELGKNYSELQGAILCCVTDVKTEIELEQYVEIFSRVASAR